MKVYTKTGDKGTTSLVGGQRVSKSHPRVEAYGTVDELISYIGLIRTYDIASYYKDLLYTIQDRLMVCAALLATEGIVEKVPQVKDEDILLLENEIDKMDAVLPPLNHFILPGGNQVSAFCHVARSVCRRAERNAIALTDNYEVPENAIRYLNRLSDYLFVLSRKLSHDFNVEEVFWIPNK